MSLSIGGPNVPGAPQTLIRPDGWQGTVGTPGALGVGDMTLYPGESLNIASLAAGAVVAGTVTSGVLSIGAVLSGAVSTGLVLSPYPSPTVPSSVSITSGSGTTWNLSNSSFTVGSTTVFKLLNPSVTSLPGPVLVTGFKAGGDWSAMSDGGSALNDTNLSLTVNGAGSPQFNAPLGCLFSAFGASHFDGPDRYLRSNGNLYLEGHRRLRAYGSGGCVPVLAHSSNASGPSVGIYIVLTYETNLLITDPRQVLYYATLGSPLYTAWQSGISAYTEETLATITGNGPIQLDTLDMAIGNSTGSFNFLEDGLRVYLEGASTPAFPEGYGGGEPVFGQAWYVDGNIPCASSDRGVVFADEVNLPASGFSMFVAYRIFSETIIRTPTQIVVKWMTGNQARNPFSGTMSLCSGIAYYKAA